MNTPGWTRIALDLAGDSSPVAGQVKKTSKAVGGAGFGVRIVSGGQYIAAIEAKLEETLYALTAPGDFTDGRVIPCPGGFDDLLVHGYSDNPTLDNTARVVLEVCQVPSAILADVGPPPLPTVRLVPTFATSGGRLHPQTGETVHVSIAAGTAIRVAALYGYDYFEDVADMPAAKYRSRVAGDQHAALLRMSDLFLHAMLFTRAADTVNVWMTALHVDANGALIRLPYYKWLNAAFTQLTGSAAVVAAGAAYYQHGSITDRVLVLAGSGVPTGNAIVLPPNGFELYVENTGVAAAEVVGMVCTRGAA